MSLSVSGSLGCVKKDPAPAKKTDNGDGDADNQQYEVTVNGTENCLIKKGFALECKPENVTKSRNQNVLILNTIGEIYDSDSAGNVLYKKKTTTIILIF